jgi:hypothetical protein
MLVGRLALAQEPVNANVNANATANVNATSPLDEPPPKPLVKRPLFWFGIVGGVAVVAAGITLAFVLNPPRDPMPTWGVALGN